MSTPPDVAKLTSLQLKVELSKRGLALEGTKEELAARLQAALRPSTSSTLPRLPTPSTPSTPSTSSTSSTPSTFNPFTTTETSISKEPELRDIEQYLDRDGFIIGLKEEENIRRGLAEEKQKEKAEEKGKEGEEQARKKKPIGSVKFFNQTKGYGVIFGEGTLELFVHHTQILGNLKALSRGVYVAYDSFVNCHDKHVAIKVEILDHKPELYKPDPEQKGHKKLLEADPDRIHSGVCRWFNIREGYGFITPDAEDTSDLFLHQSEIYAERNYRVLRRGEKVEFKLALAPNSRIVAVSVTGPGGAAIKLPPRGDSYVTYEINKDETNFQIVKNEVLEELKKANINAFPYMNPHQSYYFPESDEPQTDVHYTFFERPIQRGKGPNLTDPDERPIVKGKVTQYSARKSFGFIKSETGEELFVHQSEIHAEGYRLLIEDEEVEFRVGSKENGKKFAARVTGPGGAFVKYVEPAEEKELRVQLTKRRRESFGKRRKGKREKKESSGGSTSTTSQEGGSTTEQFYCAVCNITLIGQPQLEAHNKGKKHIKLTRAASQNDGAIYRCLDCNKSFITRQDLDKHMAGKHLGAEAQEIVSTVPPSTPAGKVTVPFSDVRASQATTIEFVPQGVNPTRLENKEPARPTPITASKTKKKKKKKRGGAGRSTEQRRGTEPAPAPVPPPDLECKLCNAKFTGEQQRAQHMVGRKHKSKMTGEPLRPKGSWALRGKKRKWPQGSQHSAVPPPVLYSTPNTYAGAGYNTPEPAYDPYPSINPSPGSSYHPSIKNETSSRPPHQQTQPYPYDAQPQGYQAPYYPPPSYPVPSYPPSNYQTYSTPGYSSYPS